LYFLGVDLRPSFLALALLSREGRDVRVLRADAYHVDPGNTDELRRIFGTWNAEKTWVIASVDPRGAGTIGTKVPFFMKPGDVAGYAGMYGMTEGSRPEYPRRVRCWQTEQISNELRSFHAESLPKVVVNTGDISFNNPSSAEQYVAVAQMNEKRLEERVVLLRDELGLRLLAVLHPAVAWLGLTPCGIVDDAGGGGFVAYSDDRGIPVMDVLAPNLDQRAMLQTVGSLLKKAPRSPVWSDMRYFGDCSSRRFADLREYLAGYRVDLLPALPPGRDRVEEWTFAFALAYGGARL
jgi:hypothetical protein